MMINKNQFMEVTGMSVLSETMDEDVEGTAQWYSSMKG